MTINQTAPVTDEELEQLIWGLERYGLYPRQLAALKELREWRKARPEAEIYAELYRLRKELKGPDGFATWKDAAIAEHLSKNLGKCC